MYTEHLYLQKHLHHYPYIYIHICRCIKGIGIKGFKFQGSVFKDGVGVRVQG